MKGNGSMRILICTMMAAFLLASCGKEDKPADGPANAAAPMNPAFVPTPNASPTRYPLPAEQPSGMVNPEAAPDVAAHVARQERCAHWREEQGGGAVRPEVAEGLARECKGIDQQLADLRRLHDRDGAAIALLRRYVPVE